MIMVLLRLQVRTTLPIWVPLLSIISASIRWRSYCCGIAFFFYFSEFVVCSSTPESCKNGMRVHLADFTLYKPMHEKKSSFRLFSGVT